MASSGTTRSNPTLSSLLGRIDAALWFVLVVSLPITSLPLVSALAGGSMVAPPAGVLALVLAGAWLVPQWVKGRGIPPHAVPLLVFAASAVISCLAAYYIAFPAFRTVDFTRQQLVELGTLGVGIATYLLTATYLRDAQHLQWTLRWINWSGLVIILWCVAQFLAWQLMGDFPVWMEDLQNSISLSRLYAGRVTGFAMEPSWLAHMLNMLYLPLWLSASMQRFTAHRWHLRRLTLENLLLAAGIAVLWFSLSRVGLVAFLLMLALVFIKLNIRLVGWLEQRVTSRRTLIGTPAPIRQRRLHVVLTSVLILFYLFLLLGSGFMLSKLDWRMARLFDFSTLAEEGVLPYANQLMIAERVVFWQTGWDIFNDYPWLGVGLGNSGYFFQETISGYGMGLTEVSQILYRETHLPNTKALWSRLLAETGLFGFTFFLAWLFLHWANGAALSRSALPLKRTLGLAGQLVVVGLLVEGFSVDSFALPYFWFLFGLSAAAWKIPT